MDATNKKITTRSPAIDSGYTSYHITRVRVPLFEVDLGQAVYHGNYFHLFEIGREDYLRQIGFPYKEFMNRELHLTIIESVCNYRKPLYYDDQVDIHTAFAWMRRRSIGVTQVIYRQEEGKEAQLCTRVDLSMVCVRFTGQAVVLPEDFRKIVENLAEKATSGN